jgi:hypothetical protein
MSNHYDGSMEINPNDICQPSEFKKWFIDNLQPQTLENQEISGAWIKLMYNIYNSDVQ